jgi:hypothetical protein
MALRFAVGEMLNHPEHGECIVTFIGEEYVGVAFANGRNALLRKESFSCPEGEPPDVTTPVLADPGPTALVSWPDNTFSPAPESSEPRMGERWKTFADDPMTFIQRLPEFLSEAHPMQGCGTLRAAPRADAAGWPRRMVTRPSHKWARFHWPACRSSTASPSGTLTITVFAARCCA